MNNSSQRLLNLTAVNINGNNLTVDTSVNLRNFLFYINSSNKIGILKSNPQYTLDIVGDINFTGKIYNNGAIITTEQAAFSLWSNNSGYIFYNGSVCVGTNNNPNPYSFYVNGTSYFVSQVTINNNLSVNGNITCQNINTSGTTTTNNLVATGTTNISGLTSTSAINTAGLNITSGNLSITSGNIIAYGSSISCDSIYILNQTTFSSNMIFENNVSILGKLTCQDNINVNNKFLINSSSGNITTSGSITASNSLSVLGTLNVGGFSELSKVKINNDLDINGNLYVNTGSTELLELNVNSVANLNADVIIDSGNVIFSKDLESIMIDYTTQSISSTSGALIVTGGVGIGGNLFVAGTINSQSGESFFNEITINNALTVNGISTLNSDVNIYGKTTIYEDLICDNPGGTITATTGLNIGNSSGSPSLTVDTLGNIETIGNCIIDGNLDLGGNISIQGNLTLAGTAGNFSGGIIANCRFIEDNLNTYDIYTTYSGSTFIIVDHTILTTINLPSTATVGTYYKIVIGPNFNSQVGNNVIITSSSSSPIINIFGMINNAGTYTSINTNSTTITLNSNVSGDFVEITGVLVDSNGTFGYYINANSSNSNGFISS